MAASSSDGGSGALMPHLDDTDSADRRHDRSRSGEVKDDASRRSRFTTSRPPRTVPRQSSLAELEWSPPIAAPGVSSTSLPSPQLSSLRQPQPKAQAPQVLTPQKQRLESVSYTHLTLPTKRIV